MVGEEKRIAKNRMCAIIITPMKKKVNKKEYSSKEIIGSIDNLAIITKKGFDGMYEFRDEMIDFKNEVGQTLFSIDSKLKTVDKRLDAIEKILGPLMKISTLMENEIRSLNSRVSLLEHKIGMK